MSELPAEQEAEVRRTYDELVALFTKRPKLFGGPLSYAHGTPLLAGEPIDTRTLAVLINLKYLSKPAPIHCVVRALRLINPQQAAKQVSKP